MSLPGPYVCKRVGQIVNISGGKKKIGPFLSQKELFIEFLGPLKIGGPKAEAHFAHVARL